MFPCVLSQGLPDRTGVRKRTTRDWLSGEEPKKVADKASTVETPLDLLVSILNTRFSEFISLEFILKEVSSRHELS